MGLGEDISIVIKEINAKLRTLDDYPDLKPLAQDIKADLYQLWSKCKEVSLAARVVMPFIEGRRDNMDMIAMLADYLQHLDECPRHPRWIDMGRSCNCGLEKLLDQHRGEREVH